MMIMTTLCNRACLSGNTASLARQAQRWMSSTMTTTASPTLNAAVPATATATTTTTATATTTTTATAQPPAQQPPQQQRRRRRRRGETNKVKTWEDSDYVVRRNSYNAQMQDIRKALHHRELDHKREALAKEQANQAELKELRRARSLRRRYVFLFIYIY